MYTDGNKCCTFIQFVRLLEKIVNIYEKSKVDMDLCSAFSLQLPLETILVPTSQLTSYTLPVWQRV